MKKWDRRFKKKPLTRPKLSREDWILVSSFLSASGAFKLGSLSKMLRDLIITNELPKRYMAEKFNQLMDDLKRSYPHPMLKLLSQCTGEYVEYS